MVELVTTGHVKKHLVQSNQGLATARATEPGQVSIQKTHGVGKDTIVRDRLVDVPPLHLLLSKLNRFHWIVVEIKVFEGDLGLMRRHDAQASMKPPY